MCFLESDPPTMMCPITSVDDDRVAHLVFHLTNMPQASFDMLRLGLLRNRQVEERSELVNLIHMLTDPHAFPQRLPEQGFHLLSVTFYVESVRSVIENLGLGAGLGAHNARRLYQITRK